ncbi:MAG: hypothetical protein J0L97_09715 [Alphaproteobacteria bacterium]|nr:hypothetical protein [Alphaproteobacteria bacterium]
MSKAFVAVDVSSGADEVPYWAEQSRYIILCNSLENAVQLQQQLTALVLHPALPNIAGGPEVVAFHAMSGGLVGDKRQTHVLSFPNEELAIRALFALNVHLPQTSEIAELQSAVTGSMWVNLWNNRKQLGNDRFGRVFDKAEEMPVAILDPEQASSKAGFSSAMHDIAEESLQKPVRRERLA